MATQEVTTFSSSLQSFIEAALNKTKLTLKDATILDELRGFLNSRPVVVLQNERAKISYLRPGIQREIQQAFTELRTFIDMPENPIVDSTVDFSDLSKPVLCSKHPDDLNRLFEVCKKVGLVRELYLEVVAHDTDYFQQLLRQDSPRRVYFSPLFASECACNYNLNNRLFSDTRYEFENHVLAHILNTVTDKKDPVRVISMGSGRLLQDWKLIGLLVQAGYTDIHWAAVDPQNSNNPSVRKVQEFFSHVSGAKINLTAYTDISSVPTTLVDAVVAIDIPAIWGDISKSCTRLQERGKVIYGHDECVFEISSTETRVLSRSSDYTRLTLGQEKCKEEVSLVCATDWPLAACAVADLVAEGYKKFTLYIGDQTIDIDTMQLFSFLFPTSSFVIKLPTAQQLNTESLIYVLEECKETIPCALQCPKDIRKGIEGEL